MALCPCHIDHNPSLSIKSDNGKILMHCHTGCATADIVASLGLTMADLHLNERNTTVGHRQIEAIYRYTDANGKPFEVVRTRPKGFYQRRPDGKGGYTNNLKGIIPTLYYQDKLKRAIDSAMPIFFVEGEKDVDRLWKLGIAATTNPMGAGKWRDNYTEFFQGADLIIIPDNDIPGHDHANHVANSCSGKAAKIRILELPGKGKDVSDWLDNGGNGVELKRLIAEAPEWKPSEDKNSAHLICMADVEAEKVEWLWYPYIPLGKLTLLEGDPGVGKSWVSLAIATAVSLGRGLFGMEAEEPAKVVIASAEDGLGDTIRPRLDIMEAKVRNIYAIKSPLDFSNGGLDILLEYVDKVKPALVIIDPLVAYIGAGVDLYRANETRAVMAQLANISEKYHVAILVIRHLTKGGMLKPIYRGLGSIDLTAACRSVLLVGCDSNNPQERGIVQIKSNLAPMGKAIGYELGDNVFYWTGESDLTSQSILSAEESENKSTLDEATNFLKVELADGPRDASQVWKNAENAGLSKTTIKRAKARLKVITRRHGETGKKGGGKFTWELPEIDLGGQGNHIKEFGPLNNSNLMLDSPVKLNGHLSPNDQSKCIPNISKELQQLSENSNNPDEFNEYDNPNQISLKDDSLINKDDPLNAPEEILGMPTEKAIEIWRSQDAPEIPLKPGENCLNLEKFLSGPNVKPADLKSIGKWLKQLSDNHFLNNQHSPPYKSGF